MDGQTIMGLATIVAVFLGPIAAVIVTRQLDATRFRRDRRMDVFRTLMRTRRMRLNPDHVGALNLVEIEFHDEKPVIDAWKTYWEHLGVKMPNEPTEAVDAFLRESDSRLTKLLHAMAKSLKFNIEQLDIFEGGYVPKGWEDEELYQRILRNLLLEILRGNRGFPVTAFNTMTGTSPYPPPPTINANA